MDLERPIVPFQEWLPRQSLAFLAMLLAVAGIGIFVGYLAAALRHGPAESGLMTWRMLSTGLRELLQLSPRRLMAVARLAFQESIRRRVLVVFVVFVVILLFAGWYLDRNSQHPARLYLSFVFGVTNLLLLVLAIFLSAFSLPNDFKNRTIHTVVTKPIRGWEIVVGRMLGFVAIGTLLLAIMGVFSYFFVHRGLRHEHTVDPRRLTEIATPSSSSDSDIDPSKRRVKTGVTSQQRDHRHNVHQLADGTLEIEPTRDHTHKVISTSRNGDEPYVLGPAQGLLLARVPIRGELRFLDRSGQPGEGTNIGDEYKYRSYIEGGTLAAAIWRFRDLRPEDYGDTLPLEMTVRAFRTFKGEMEKGLTGTIELVKPVPRNADGSVPRTARDGGLKSDPISFTIEKEYEILQPRIPRRWTARDAQGNEHQVDILRDLVDPQTGELEVWVRCLDRAQYLGMAPADLYLRARNRPFWINFLKGYFGLWLQMTVVICLGVMFSTILSGPVAMTATLGALVMGFFKGFVVDVVTGVIPGGGPVESLVRLVRQWNQMSQLEPGITTGIIQTTDDILMLFVRGISQAMPNCGSFDNSSFVAYGYDIPADLLASQVVTALAYGGAIAVAAYFCFKTREIAA
jgi:ABC-type transport system involved in multi-copper enzyme maturation permease subunit